MWRKKPTIVLRHSDAVCRKIAFTPAVLSVSEQKQRRIRPVEEPATAIQIAEPKRWASPSAWRLQAAIPKIRDLDATMKIEKSKAKVIDKEIINGKTRSVYAAAKQVEIVANRPDAVFLIGKGLFIRWRDADENTIRQRLVVAADGRPCRLVKQSDEIINDKRHPFRDSPGLHD